VKVIGAGSFLAEVGYENPTALLPSLLTSTLGALGRRARGAIEGVSDALAGAAQLFIQETGAVFTQWTLALFTQETPGRHERVLHDVADCDPLRLSRGRITALALACLKDEAA
jgi:hypothetical protein